MLEKGPKWFWVSTYKVSKGGDVKRERKGDLLMHASIYAIFSLFLSSFTTSASFLFIL